MLKFFYIARDKAGKKITGVEEASNQEEATSRLQARELIVISVIVVFREIALSISLYRVASRWQGMDSIAAIESSSSPHVVVIASSNKGSVY